MSLDAQSRLKSLKRFLGTYLNMVRKRGPSFAANHFFQDHLFDLTRGTDTTRVLEKQHYREQPDGFEHGNFYMGSWTSIVRKATQRALRSYKGTHEGLSFIDVGCGKGKVLLVWNEMFRGKDIAKITGIEYSQELGEICRANLDKVNSQNADVIVADALAVDLAAHCPCLVYMYNPFGPELMGPFLDKLAQLDCCVVYSNQQHDDLAVQKGFRKIHEEKRGELNTHFAIYAPPGR